MLFLPALLVYAYARGTFARASTSMLLGGALSAWFLLPALVENSGLKVRDVITSGGLYYGNHFVSLRDLVWSPWGFGLSWPRLSDAVLAELA